MFDSTKELLDRIRLGESTYLELGEVRFADDGVAVPDTDTLADEPAAFANSRGGVFVFGVEDRTRDVVGIPAERLDTVVDFIKEVCATRLRLFENRLEIYSPGAIANSLTIDNLRYRQSARNEALCSLLAKCPAPDESWLVTDRTNIMDRRGEGVPVILDNSTRLSGKEPHYRLIDDAELHLTIYAATPARTGSA